MKYLFLLLLYSCTEKTNLLDKDITHLNGSIKNLGNSIVNLKCTLMIGRLIDKQLLKKQKNLIEAEKYLNDIGATCFEVFHE